jgi:hypothetical protein
VTTSASQNTQASPGLSTTTWISERKIVKRRGAYREFRSAGNAIQGRKCHQKIEKHTLEYLPLKIMIIEHRFILTSAV